MHTISTTNLVKFSFLSLLSATGSGSYWRFQNGICCCCLGWEDLELKINPPSSILPTNWQFQIKVTNKGPAWIRHLESGFLATN